MTMSFRSSFGVIFIVTVALAPLSCRTYGGYGSEAAALQQIEAAHQAFARDLARAQIDLRALGEAGQETDRFSPLAARMEQAVAWHESMVVEHESLLEAARQKPGAYRFLSRTLRGMLAEQEIVHARYREIAQSIASQSNGRTEPGSPLTGARYHVVPPYYERLTNAQSRRSAGAVSWALQGVDRSAPVSPDTLGHDQRSAPDIPDAAPAP